jgi:hypothetical protein
MARPTCERPPTGLNSYWTHTWQHALATLKAQGSWAWEQKPLLDEYVYALMGAETARKGFKWLDALEVYADNADGLPEIAWSTLGKIAAGLPTQWDRHTKRAMALADQLALSERGRKAVGVGEQESDEPADPFADLDGGATILRAV